MILSQIKDSNGLDRYTAKKRRSEITKESVSKRRKISDYFDSKQTPISEATIEQSSSSTVVSTENVIEQCSSVDSNEIALIEFSVGDVVWAKIKGYPHWPAKITAFTSKLMVEVFWFNDYRRTKIYRTQLSKFIPCFEQFSVHFDNHVGLRTAAKEAMIYYGNSLQVLNL